MVTVLDLLHVHNFLGQTVNGVKLLLCLELIIVLLCMFKELRILVLGEGPTQVLDDATITAEAKYPINFTKPGRRYELSLQYNWRNNFLFVNAFKIYQFKAKDSQSKRYSLFFGNILKYFTISSLKKTGLKGSVTCLS